MFDVIYRYDPDNRRERQQPASADEAQCRLEDGNRAFASFATGATTSPRIVQMDLEGIGLSTPGDVLRQQPFAVVLGCADARVPVEMIFDRACNELFVVRVAGNIISEVLLGSIDYAVQHLGKNLKLIVVLGHSHCGAVTAAVDAFLRPSEYLGLASSHHLRAIVNTLFPAVRGAVQSLSVTRGNEVSSSPGYRRALIECSVLTNAALMATILESEFVSPERDLRVVFGAYDLGSRRVQVSYPLDEAKEPVIRLMDAPRGVEEFRRFASEVASSSLITGLLDGQPS